MGELIFMTGSSGFIGSATALEALRSGYRLRLCLRRPCKKLEDLLSEYSQQVEYVIISDLTNEAEFAGQLEGVDYVIHVASPLPHHTEKKQFFTPAVTMITAVLREAANVPSVKKVVVTSSLVSLLPLGRFPGGIVKGGRRRGFTVIEDPTATALNLYYASKLLANKATWNFRKDQRPHYSIVVLHPGFTFGHNYMQTNAEEIRLTSNEGFWQNIMSSTQATSLNSLSPKIPDGSSYLLAPNKVTWKEVAEILHQAYPDLHTRIAADMKGNPFLPCVLTDCSRAEADLKMKWRSMDQMVRDLMDQQLAFQHHN
ncbi:NAD-dependent epimerase/dehydratase [Penicillium longicatenatum]|nr:NAD-dependent epimerase/dehydratase [Penicillium longicatenatum]